MSDKLTLRPARIAERGALEALQRRASLVALEYRQALLDHPDAIELPAEQIDAGEVVVAECRGRIIGFAVVQIGGDGEAELDGLFVEPDEWRKGTARALIDDCARRAAAQGANYLCVTGNPSAIGFYNAVGFTSIGDAQTRFGPAPRLRRALK